MRCQAHDGCGIDCDPRQGCGCIYIYPGEEGGPGECICECYASDNRTVKVKVSIGDVVRDMPIQSYKPKFKTTAQTKMDICVSNFPVAALAQILDRIFPDKILVPAKEANVRITLRSRNSKISRIAKSSSFTMKR
jgi:hypothetical protein